MDRQGQLAIGEMVVAIAVFLVIVAVVVLFLRTNTAEIRESLVHRDLESKATSIADVLVKSRGVPSGWELSPSSASVIGLASESRVLSPGKVAAFMAMDHAVAQDIFAMAPYDYAVTLARTDGSPIASTGTVTGKRVVGVRRVVLYGNETAFLTVRLHG